MHATVGQPVPQFGCGGARVPEREEFVGVAVQWGGRDGEVGGRGSPR